MTANDIVKRLHSLGSGSYRKILLNHGTQEPVLGVKISELQKIRKKIGKNYQLALEVYDTGIYDAQYLAGLIADETKMTKKDLRRWLAKANSTAICGTVVAWVAAESAHGRELALDWIDSAKESNAQAGWDTLASLVSIKKDSELEVPELKHLLARVGKTIHDQPNYVRYAMNSFLIALGAYVRQTSDAAIQTAEKIGVVSVDMGNTACEVPYAPDYIKKAHKHGSLAKKRKTARC
jgi:3-methyladenine DNA glycosylase AlkD